MGYTKLDGQTPAGPGLERAVLAFIRERCEGLRFNPQIEAQEKTSGPLGTSLRKQEIPYNMQMDIDRLCLENAMRRFLRSGRKEDAFDVYFCYLEMFVGDYEKTQKMIELLSEFESNGGSLLMKHRDHYVHSVYVFALGLAIYETSPAYRETYSRFYRLEEGAACHYLEHWGLTALFHDIGYPFELPFEQAASYFETTGGSRTDNPFLAYRNLDALTRIDGDTARRVRDALGITEDLTTTDQLFACILSQKLSGVYAFTQEQMLRFLEEKPTHPERFGYYMDHAYFSSAILFQKLFCEMKCAVRPESLDALGAILLHNSLYKFCVAHYKDDAVNIPLRAELYPLAFMLMLCDELQCWDRTAYGRNSRQELHPMDCRFDFSGGVIRAVYLFDQRESPKIELYEAQYAAAPQNRKPSLKAYSNMCPREDRPVPPFQEDIERIVDLSGIPLEVRVERAENIRLRRKGALCQSNFIHLYNFAAVLNGRWSSAEWREAKEQGREEAFLADPEKRDRFLQDFKELSLEYKLSNINQAKAFAAYLEKIGCFYTDQPVDFEMLECFTPRDLEKIGPMEHQRWLQEHYDMGWSYGWPASSKEREQTRTHKDLIPDFNPCLGPVTPEQARVNFLRLESQAERDKDTEPMECMLAMLRMFDGLRIYRLNEA